MWKATEYQRSASNAQLSHQDIISTARSLLEGQHMLVLLLWNYHIPYLFPLAHNTFTRCLFVFKLCFICVCVVYVTCLLQRQKCFEIWVGGVGKISNTERKVLERTEKTTQVLDHNASYNLTANDYIVRSAKTSIFP